MQPDLAASSVIGRDGTIGYILNCGTFLEKLDGIHAGACRGIEVHRRGELGGVRWPIEQGGVGRGGNDGDKGYNVDSTQNEVRTTTGGAFVTC